MYQKGETMQELFPCVLGFFALADILHCYVADLCLTVLVF